MVAEQRVLYRISFFVRTVIVFQPVSNAIRIVQCSKLALLTVLHMQISGGRCFAEVTQLEEKLHFLWNRYSTLIYLIDPVVEGRRIFKK